MARYIVQRLLQTIPSILAVTIVAFFVLRVLPGDVTVMILGPEATQERVDVLRQALGLDRPLALQYWDWVSSLFRGDLGVSLASYQPVGTLIVSSLGASAQLATTSFLLMLVFGLTIGVIISRVQGRLTDASTSIVLVVVMSVPTFIYGILLILAFSVLAGWLPASGFGGWRLDWSVVKYLLLPAITLALPNIASLARFVKNAFVEQSRQDYVRTARAKGVEPRTIVSRHVLRNALIPVITVAGVQFSQMLAGAVFTESVFAWPGMGRLIVQAVANRDYPVLQGIILVITFLFILLNLLVDVLYAAIDPRVTYS